MMHRDQLPEKIHTKLNSTSVGSPCISMHFGARRKIAVRWSFNGDRKSSVLLECSPAADMEVGGGIERSVSILPASDEDFNMHNYHGKRLCGTVLHGVPEPLPDNNISVGVIARSTVTVVQVDTKMDAVRWNTGTWARYKSEAHQIKYCKAGYAVSANPERKYRVGGKVPKHQYYRDMAETWAKDAPEWSDYVRDSVLASLRSWTE